MVMRRRMFRPRRGLRRAKPRYIWQRDATSISTLTAGQQGSYDFLTSVPEALKASTTIDTIKGNLWLNVPAATDSDADNVYVTFGVVARRAGFTTIDVEDDLNEPWMLWESRILRSVLTRINGTASVDITETTYTHPIEINTRRYLKGQEVELYGYVKNASTSENSVRFAWNISTLFHRSR